MSTKERKLHLSSNDIGSLYETTSLSFLSNEQITSEQYDNSRPLICQETACELKHKLGTETSQGSMLSNDSTSKALQVHR